MLTAQKNKKGNTSHRLQADKKLVLSVLPNKMPAVTQAAQKPQPIPTEIITFLTAEKSSLQTHRLLKFML
jgi:hypothetical protein